MPVNVRLTLCGQPLHGLIAEALTPFTPAFLKTSDQLMPAGMSSSEPKTDILTNLQIMNRFSIQFDEPCLFKIGVSNSRLLLWTTCLRSYRILPMILIDQRHTRRTQHGW